MLKKGLIALALILVLTISPIMAADFDFGGLKDATDNSYTWYIPTTTPGDTSKILNTSEFHNVAFDWKVTNAGVIAVRFVVARSVSGANWVRTDSLDVTSDSLRTLNITTTPRSKLMVIIYGFTGNTNSYVAVNYFLQE